MSPAASFEGTLDYRSLITVASAAVVAALVSWHASRPYIEPAGSLHRYWWRFLGAGVALIALVNAGSAADIAAPWLLLFGAIILGILLCAIGVILGVWNGFAALRQRGENGAWPAS